MLKKDQNLMISKIIKLLLTLKNLSIKITELIAQDFGEKMKRIFLKMSH